MSLAFEIKPVYRMALPLLVGTLTYLAILLAFDSVANITEDFFSRELLFCVISSFFLLELNRLILLYFEKRSTKTTHFFKHSIQLIISSICITIFTISLLLVAYFYWIENMVDPRIYLTELSIFNGVFLFVSLMYQGHFLGFYFIHMKFEKDLEVELKEKEELDRSKNQFQYMLNPNFLLLGLESILLRIKEENSEEAEEGILLLSEVYRHSLRTQEELVPLHEELMALENMKIFLNQFNSKHIHLTLPKEESGLLIAPRTLTKILEAISHSQLSSFKCPLEIHLEIRKTCLHLSFSKQFSLRNGNQLVEALNSIKQQYGWLNKDLSWTDNSLYSISVPMEQPYKEPTDNMKKSSFNPNLKVDESIGN